MSLRHIKTVKAKGRTYLYFDTGAEKGGRKIYKRLPDLKDRSFGATYAAYLAHRNRRVDPEPAETLIPQLVDLYQKSPQYGKLSKGTQKTYDIYLKKLADRFYNTPVNGIERQDMVLFMDLMADKPIAANMTVRVANTLYAWARKRGHASISPFQDIELFEGGEHEPWPIHLLDAALASDDTQVRTLAGLLYYTAQRVGDVIKMRWSDIRDGRICIVQQKTRKEMTIPIHSGLQAILDRAPKKGLTIVTRHDGGSFLPQRARDILQGFAGKQGIKIVPHGLRKNAVNALLEAGCSAAETAAISGQSLQMVEHYAKQRSSAKLSSAAILKWEQSR